MRIMSRFNFACHKWTYLRLLLFLFVLKQHRHNTFPRHCNSLSEYVHPETRYTHLYSNIWEVFSDTHANLFPARATKAALCLCWHHEGQPARKCNAAQHQELLQRLCSASKQSTKRKLKSWEKLRRSSRVHRSRGERAAQTWWIKCCCSILFKQRLSQRYVQLVPRIISHR